MALCRRIFDFCFGAKILWMVLGHKVDRFGARPNPERVVLLILARGRVNGSYLPGIRLARVLGAGSGSLSRIARLQGARIAWYA